MHFWTRTTLVGLSVIVVASGAPLRAAAQSTPRKDASKFDACALLTLEDIKEAAGWTPETTELETFQRRQPVRFAVRAEPRHHPSSSSCRPACES